MPSSARTVFIVPELLEMILSQVDIQTLLTSATRVDKTWHALISSSQNIQRLLFFQPVAASSGDEPLVNPLLVQAFGECFFDLAHDHTSLRRADSFLKLPWASKSLQQAHAPSQTQDVLSPESIRRCFTRRGASWRRMFPSQPPPRCLGYISINADRLQGRILKKTRIKPVPPGRKSRGDGLRMGQLYDAIHQLSCKADHYSVWFKINWFQPRPHFATQACEAACQDLQTETSVVIEFYERPDTAGWQCPPWKIGRVRSLFRCDEFRRTAIRKKDVQIVRGDEEDVASFDFTTCVFWK